MKQFVAIVHKDPDSAYGLTFPDAPGCFSASDDLEGIVAAGSEALGLHFEDAEEVPEPRDLSALQDEVRQAIAEGAVSSVLIPYIGRAGRVERVNISLDTAVLAAIDKEAENRNLTRSAFIAAAATAEIEQRPATAVRSATGKVLHNPKTGKFGGVVKEGKAKRAFRTTGVTFHRAKTG